MSLDVYLTRRQKIECDCGTVHFVEADQIFEANITHNLARMADAAGIYNELWRPDENGIEVAQQLIGPLSEAVARLKADRAKFERFNAENGWGKYEHFVPFVEEYLAACVENPEASVYVSR